MLFPYCQKLLKILVVPASSAKSERVFSVGGNFVTAKRNSLGAKTVENLIIIKENKSQVENFKANTSYALRKVSKSLEEIAIEMKLPSILSQEEAESDDLFNISFVDDDDIVPVNRFSDDEDDNSSSDSDDDDNLII